MLKRWILVLVIGAEVGAGQRMANGRVESLTGFEVGRVTRHGAWDPGQFAHRQASHLLVDQNVWPSTMSTLPGSGLLNDSPLANCIPSLRVSNSGATDDCTAVGRGRFGDARCCSSIW
jgi:hypothetical protein